MRRNERRSEETFKIAVLKMGERTDCGQAFFFKSCWGNQSLILVGTSSGKFICLFRLV